MWNQFVGQGLEGQEEASSPNEESAEESEGPVEEPSEPSDPDEAAMANLELHKIISSTQSPIKNEESNKIIINEDKESIEVKSSNEPEEPIKLEPEPLITETPTTETPTTETPNISSQPILPVMHRIFSHNQQYYIASGTPEFYGDFDPLNNPTAPIFSLQELQPITRTHDNDEKVQKIAPLPLPTTEATSTLRIKVIDEDETEEIKKGESESEQLQLRSKPSDDQVTEKEELKSRKMEKKNQLAPEGRELSDESPIAQANPSGIAIAGNGGVASSKPLANAISGPNGLSVASPSATSVAGDFGFSDNDDDDRMKPKTRRPVAAVQAYRKTVTY